MSQIRMGQFVLFTLLVLTFFAQIYAYRDGLVSTTQCTVSGPTQACDRAARNYCFSICGGELTVNIMLGNITIVILPSV
jgi:hypothetical protein